MIQAERLTVDSEGSDVAIRQIAILLHALPERTHRVLLGQLDGDEKSTIAEELNLLGDVDPLEQHRVLKRMHEALQSETSSAEHVESEIQDEIQIGKARVSKKRAGAVYPAAENAGAKDDAVKTTTVADQASPTHSGAQPLAPEPQPAAHFGTQTDVVTGQAAVSPTPEMLQSMFAQFHQTQAAGVLPRFADKFGSASHSPGFSSQTDGEPRLLRFDQESGPNSTAEDVRDEASDSFDAEELARRVDQFLSELESDKLCKALGMVSTKEAFLVLCGLPNEKAETVLDMLPRRQARKVRSDMRKMGRLQLSEIDAAKQSVAQIALRLISQPDSLAA